MYKQIDGFSMRIPLGLELANTFLGFHEMGLISAHEKAVYFRYIEDILSFQ